jgi:hypothetical protein
MTLTADEVVRRIRHTIAGSHWEDVKMLEEYVNQRVSERLKARMELIEALIEGAQIEYSKHARLQELLKDYK